MYRDQYVVHRGVPLGEDDVEIVEVRVNECGKTMHVLGLAGLMVPVMVGG